MCAELPLSVPGLGLQGMSDCLRYELDGSGVKVSLGQVCNAPSR